MKNRQRIAKQKVYNSTSQQSVSIDFNKIKIGKQTLQDAIYDISGPLKRANPRLGNKDAILKAIKQHDYSFMREASNYFYQSSGIYQRLCRYMAYLYNYDWVITPHIIDEKRTEKALTDFYNALYMLDDFGLKKFFGETALKVIRNGCYYGYIVELDKKVAVQELPPKYCRTRFEHNGRPVIEFYMAYFDDMFPDAEQRMRMLKLYPDDFRKGYLAYKRGTLLPMFEGDVAG